MKRTNSEKTLGALGARLQTITLYATSTTKPQSIGYIYTEVVGSTSGLVSIQSGLWSESSFGVYKWESVITFSANDLPSWPSGENFIGRVQLTVGQSSVADPITITFIGKGAQYWVDDTSIELTNI